MRSLISEFSYGFALTHELVLGMGQLQAAPVFPSLIEEGKSGGGYDLKLEAPGLALFVQFKRAECLSRSSAREIKAGAQLSAPYYRMPITAKADSAQHEMLLQLDVDPNIVVYAAPMFHRKEEFDAAFLASEVRQRSFYARPRDIGPFADSGSHHVSFDGGRFYVMSEPKQIKGFGISELQDLLFGSLSADDRPIRSKLGELVAVADAARVRARQRLRGTLEGRRADDDSRRISQRAGRGNLGQFINEQIRKTRTTPRDARPLSPEQQALQTLADIGLREFNAQLYIVQHQ